MPDQNRPVIALNGFLLVDERERLTLDMRYARAVWNAGGLPVPITPLADGAYLDDLLDRVQGLVLSGGDDFDTERLGLGPMHPSAVATDPGKQDFDLDLVQRALERDLPVLGICYGMQLMGLAGGCGLLQHLPEDRPGCQEHSGGAEHPVQLERGTKLSHTMGIDEVPVVSRHHQALHAVPAPWVVSARDGEGLVEAIERPDRAFAVGVQWHPEASEQDGPHGRLFAGLIAAARAYNPSPLPR
ncbi:MAG: gamma-glutamyl-gamma-aminobutyrate hydrolase family protein [Planctomycetota bacterium]